MNSIFCDCVTNAIFYVTISQQDSMHCMTEYEIKATHHNKALMQCVTMAEITITPKLTGIHTRELQLL